MLFIVLDVALDDPEYRLIYKSLRRVNNSPYWDNKRKKLNIQTYQTATQEKPSIMVFHLSYTLSEK